MALKVIPLSGLSSLVKGEDVSCTLNVNSELDGNTLSSYIYEIYDGSGNPVTSDFSGGSSEFSGVITFGIIAHEVGRYTLKFVVTCDGILPDNTTPYEFCVKMPVKIDPY